jgi:hypothetical protein
MQLATPIAVPCLHLIVFAAIILQTQTGPDIVFSEETDLDGVGERYCHAAQGDIGERVAQGVHQRQGTDLLDLHTTRSGVAHAPNLKLRAD